jgi:formylglycine-generating enzyme required for sulfatase activity
MASLYTFGNKFSFKNNKLTIRNSLLPDFNGANTGFAIWNGITRHLTTVGTNGRPSYYGCFDMTGNAYTWNDLNGTASAQRGLRGGDWDDYYTNDESSKFRFSYTITSTWSTVGFRVASLSNEYSLNNFVLVGDINNSADTTGYGAVSYSYYMNKYHVTNNEYVEFLNAIAKTDTYSVYTTSMNSDARAGIIRSGSSGNYVYSVKTNYGNKPAVLLNWLHSARYCNWLHNNKPTGAQNSGTTEGGAYTLNGRTSGNAVVKNSGAKYHIPTENEWYKAGYYKGGGTNKGYWLYGTQSNTRPAPVYADENGNGTIRPVSLKPTTVVGSNVSTTPVSDRIYNTNIVVNYSNVSSAGITAITPITQKDPKLPANFSLSNNLGKYNISTNSSISGSIDTCFTLPASVTQSVFDKTRIFHTNSSGVTSDVTVLTGPNAPNYSLRKICCRTTSFSDFHMVPEIDFVDQPIPNSISGIPANGTIDLSWSISDTTDIENYIIKYSTDTGSSWTEFNHNASTGLAITVDGLTNNTSYIFTISSVSSSGMSNFSNPSSSFTPIPSIPDSPTNVVGIPGIESVDLRWDVPNDGGSSITDYIVQYSSDSGATWTTTSESIILFADDISTTRNFTVYNLGIIPYIFKVCAVTEAGNSDFSTPSDPVTPYSDSYDIYIATYSTIDPNLIP